MVRGKHWKKEVNQWRAIFIVHVATSNVLEIFSVRNITAFCMLGRTPLLLLLTNSFSSTYVHYDIILFHFVSFCFNSQWSSPYFLVFSPLYFSQFVNHEQLISSLITPFDMWLIMITSTLLALTSWCSTNRRTSQNTCTLFNSYTGFGFTGEYQGGIWSTRHKSCKISKNLQCCSMSGNVLVLFKGHTTSQDMGDTTYHLTCKSPHSSCLCACFGRHTAS